MDAKWPRVVQDHAQVLSTFHVILASVVIGADVRDLFVNCTSVIPLTLVVVILVAVILIRVLRVLVLLSDLENDLVLLLLVKIVRIDQLELRVMTDVVVLFHRPVLVNYIQDHGLLLNQELWVLVL